MSNYEFWLTDDRARRVKLIESFEELTYSRVVNDVGTMRLVLPGTFDESLLRKDWRIEVWRAARDARLRLERSYLIRRIAIATDANGDERVTVSGVDAMDLLNRRIVAYNADTAYTTKSDQADDLMKAVVRENLGASATDTDRAFNATYFTVAADAGLGPTIAKSFTRRNVLVVLQELADAARTGGTEVYFDVVEAQPALWQFQTFVGQPGYDRRFGQGNALLFDQRLGNLIEPEIDEDWTNERNYVYAGGQGEGADRLVETAQDAASIGGSIWSRSEFFIDARNTTDDDVQTEADHELTHFRGVKRFRAQLVETANCRYGVEYDLGDRVTASYRGQQYDAMLRMVTITVRPDGENLNVRFETE